MFYQGERTYHHGLRNLTVAIDAALANFPDPSRVVVSGSSAGGYGTFAGYGVTRIAYPETQILVLNDSGPGVQNEAAAEDVQNRVANWNFVERIPTSCDDCLPQVAFLASWALDRDPEARFGLYSYQQDRVISFFIDLDGPSYQDLLLTVTDQVQARHPDRFKRYFPQGSTHTVLLSPEFYTQSIAGVRLLDWTNAFLDDPDSWRDVIE